MAEPTGTSSWAPLSRRERVAAGAVLLAGVPEHLDAPLREWAHTTLASPTFAGVPERLLVRLHLVAAQLVALGEPELAAEEALAYGTDEDQLLDVVDAALAFHPSHAAITLAEESARHASERSLGAVVAAISRTTAASSLDSAAGRLRSLLDDANSLWTVAPDQRGLQRRIEAALSAAIDDAEATAREGERQAAADDLAAARAQLYGIHPDASSAYRLAVRAVEHAAVPVVLPRDRHATVTKVRNHLREVPERWQLATGGDAGVVVAMLSELAAGQSDRHGGQAGDHTPTTAAAEVALELATVLVHWFTAGHVQRVQQVS